MAVRVTKRHNADGSITKRTTVSRKTFLGTTKSDTYVEKIPANKKGCYIATSVYGSYDCPQVWTLRRYRDNQLAKSHAGRLFIRAYYSISPTLVKYFGSTKLFKTICRKKLDKFVGKLQSEGFLSTPYIDK